jgi:hypothetical protein
MADSPRLLTPDQLQVLYFKLDELIAEARSLRENVGQALVENRRADQQRVTPERRRGHKRQ